MSASATKHHASRARPRTAPLVSCPSLSPSPLSLPSSRHRVIITALYDQRNLHLDLSPLPPPPPLSRSSKPSTIDHRPTIVVHSLQDVSHPPPLPPPHLFSSSSSVAPSISPVGLHLSFSLYLAHTTSVCFFSSSLLFSSLSYPTSTYLISSTPESTSLLSPLHVLRNRHQQLRSIALPFTPLCFCAQSQTHQSAVSNRSRTWFCPALCPLTLPQPCPAPRATSPALVLSYQKSTTTTISSASIDRSAISSATAHQSSSPYS